MREFIPGPVIKDIVDQAMVTLYSDRADNRNPKEAIMSLWGDHRSKLSTTTNADILNEFEQDLFNSLGPQSGRTKGKALAKALSKYQVQSENGITGLWIDFFDFIDDLGKEDSKADLKWLRLLSRPEKFCQYFETDKRFVMHGFRNQALISKAIADRSVDSLKPIVVMKDDFEKLLDFDFDGDPSNERQYQFEKTQFVLNKIRSLKSLTSILAPQKRMAYVTAKNTEWKGDPPTAEQSEKYGITQQERTTFASKPVWLVDDLKWMLSPNQSLKLNELLTKRAYEEPDLFGGLDNANSAVKHFIEVTSKLSAIKLQNGSIECYKPLEDSLVFNKEKAHENPWLSLAKFSSMLAKSTCHLNGRQFQKIDSEAAKLEAFHNIIIGHNAVMKLYHHLQDINMGYISPEEDELFHQYHEEFLSKNQELIADVKRNFFNEKSIKYRAIEEFLKSVSETQMVIQTGYLQEQKITPELRQTALKENVAAQYSPSANESEMISNP